LLKKNTTEKHYEGGEVCGRKKTLHVEKGKKFLKEGTPLPGNVISLTTGEKKKEEYTKKLEGGGLCP